MAKLVAQEQTWLPVAVADTTNFTNTGFMAVQGGSSTQYTHLYEVYMGGQATVTSPCIMVLARDSTVGATLSVGTLAPLDPATAALAAPPVVFNTATTKPQRDTAKYLLNLSFNAFGGVVRWNAAPDQDPRMLGNAASFGEISLSAFTGGTPGLIGSHFIIETL